jgi:hypothetical protein
MSIDLESLTTRLSPEEQRAVKASYRTQAKSPTTAFLLCFFLGIFGAHRFYLGDVTGGVVRLVLSPLIIPGLILEIFELPRIDGEVAHQNLGVAEGIIARVMLDHPDPHFQSQAAHMVDESLAHAAEHAPAPAPAPADAGVVAPAALGAAAAAATMAAAMAAERADLATHPEPPPAPEPAPAPVAAEPAPEPAPPSPAAEAAGPPPPIWPVPEGYQPEQPAADSTPPELRFETDTTPYPPPAPAAAPSEAPGAHAAAPAGVPAEAPTMPWGELAGGAVAGGMAEAILGPRDASPEAVPLGATPATPPAATGEDQTGYGMPFTAPVAAGGVDLTDQGTQFAGSHALAEVGEPFGERVHVKLPEPEWTPETSTLVLQPQDKPAEHDAGWWTAAAIGGGAAALGAAEVYEHAAHHEPAVEQPPAAAEPAAPPPEPARTAEAPAPAAAEPEHHTVKRVRVVRRLMVDGKVVQETAAEEVVDADADTAATAARLRESLGATDPDTLAALAQQSVEADQEQHDR